MPTVDRTFEKDKCFLQETYASLCQFETQHPDLFKLKPIRGPSSTWTLAQLSMFSLVRSYFNVSTYLDVFRGPWPAYLKEIFKFALPHYTTFMRRLRKLESFLRQYWETQKSTTKTGIFTIDSTVIPLGKPYLCQSDQAYKGLKKAGIRHGKKEEFIFFGLKLHVLLDEKGKVVQSQITSTHEHDLNPVKEGLLDGKIGIVLADSAYISEPLAFELQEKSIALWAKPKKNQWLQFCPVQTRFYRRRQQVEKTFETLKSNFMLVARRPPRTLHSAKVMVWSALIAFQRGGGKHELYWKLKWFKA